MILIKEKEDKLINIIETYNKNKGENMTKEELRKIKKRLIALGILGVMIGTSGCKNVDENGIPLRHLIPKEYNKFDKYVVDVVRNNQVYKMCKTENVYLLFDKETFAAKEYIYDTQFQLMGTGYGCQLYDIANENLICYNDGIDDYVYNKDYYDYLMKNNYIVSLSDLANYIEDIEVKEYYSLDEIRELEPQILESLKLIVASKTKIK